MIFVARLMKLWQRELPEKILWCSEIDAECSLAWHLFGFVLGIKSASCPKLEPELLVDNFEPDKGPFSVDIL